MIMGRMYIGFHWEDDAEIGCKLISPIDLCCFSSTFSGIDFDIANIEKEGLWNRIGVKEQDQTKGISQTECSHLITVIGIMNFWKGTDSED